MNSVTQHLIKVLEGEIAERMNVITKLREMKTTGTHSSAAAHPSGPRNGKAAKKSSGNGWSPERLRKFRASMAAKKKAAAGK